MDEQQPEIVAALRLIAAWHTPGGATPKTPMPVRYEVCTKAAHLLEKQSAELAKLQAASTAPAAMYVECRECSDCGHAGINDAHDTNARCSLCDWSGESPKEDKCPECMLEGTMTSACPKCSGRYRLVADAKLAGSRAGTVGQAAGGQGDGKRAYPMVEQWQEFFEEDPITACWTLEQLKRFVDADRAANPTAAPVLVPLPEGQRRTLVGNWFAEGWAMKAALGMLDDYDTLTRINGMTVGGAG